MQKRTHHVSVPSAQPKQAGCRAEHPTPEDARAGGEASPVPMC